MCSFQKGQKFSVVVFPLDDSIVSQCVIAH